MEVRAALLIGLLSSHSVACEPDQVVDIECIHAACLAAPDGESCRVGLNASASGPAENAVDPRRDDSLFLERPELPQAHGSTIGRHRDLVAGG